MQTATTPTPVAPATPATPQAVTIEIPGTPTRPITEAEMQVIRRQRSEMSNQLSSAQNRREEVLDQIRSAPAGTEEGLRQHLTVLNNRIAAIENDLEVSGRTLRSGQVPVGTVLIAPRSFEPDVQAAAIPMVGLTASIFSQSCPFAFIRAIISFGESPTTWPL